MSTKHVTITYVLISNERPLTSNTPTNASVWREELELSRVDLAIQTTVDWCYDRIIEAHPEYTHYLIAIWAIDVLPE